MGEACRESCAGAGVRVRRGEPCMRCTAAVHVQSSGHALRTARGRGAVASGARLRLGCCAVLVGAADEHRVVAARAAVARVAVRAQHAADDVAQVRHVVHVGQRARDQNVALACVRRVRLRCRTAAQRSRHTGGTLSHGTDEGLWSWRAASIRTASALQTALPPPSGPAAAISLFTVVMWKQCMHTWLANA